ncbi:MAG TPA: protein kinase [Solirubrobacteraceae bacterium]|nr:protein kinase [Solirubrobacteraceae bacterium]
MSTLVGTSLSGRYRLEARIAAGGMSTVYRALDETLERQVAVKLMNREVATDSDQLERFRREARAVAQLSHPHIVGVIDAGEDDGRPYIVFEYVEGETLKDRIRRLGRLPITEAVAYAIEIARALGAAHARHIVHRDVKPQNVLLDHEGSAKVTDFGIARTLEEEGLTADGRVLGTTDYVSPEQALGQPVTGQSDLYSLGVVLYEMLTGEVPFRGESQVAVAMKHVREQIPDVQLKRPEASSSLAAVVETATAKRLDERYADDAELIADLEDVLALETARTGNVRGEVTTVLRTLPPRSRQRVPLRRRLRRPVVIGLLACIVAGVGGAVAVYLGHQAHSGGAAATSTHQSTQAPPRRIAICSTCATDYNPDPLSGPKTQNPQMDPYAVDGDPSTAWKTQIYDNGTLGKPGVGLYVDARRNVVAGSLRLVTSTPGYAVTIYGSRLQPNPDTFTTGSGGWTKLSTVASVQAHQSIPLTTHGTAYRYCLVWITQLNGANPAAINEISLYTR